MSQSKSYVLSSQIQRTFPNVKNSVKRHSLQATLQQLSEESLLHELEEKKKRIVIQIPQKSAKSDEVNMRF